MKKIQLFIFILLIPLVLNSYIFEVDKIESLIFISSALALDLSNNYFDRQFIEAPTNLELDVLDENDVPFFDRIGLQSYSAELKDFSDYTAYLAIGTTLYCLYESDKEILLDNLLVLSEIMIAQSAIAKWTKTLTHRYRPFVYDENMSYDKKKERNSQHSFYSMHSSTVFAAATSGYYYYSNNYGHNILIGSILFGSASATAVLRVASAQHFPSDVIVGAVVGSSISYAICKYHQDKKLKLSFGYDSVNISYKF
ncbi:MAG: phosphatase PAP2 family protein [Candidatus Cloacimonadota bacterium]|nr:phosphatase PAP2 family protein [Candidatus Cloacimonadota bacterium]